MQAVAGIDIYGDTVRYAEVQSQGEGVYRLRRLGSCDFAFDVADELLHGDDTQHTDVLTNALRDVFAGTEATTLRIALHPTDAYAFFTLVGEATSDAQRQEQMAQEAALLAEVSSPDTLHVTSEAVRTDTLSDGRSVEWMHVLALPTPVQERLAAAVRPLPHERHEWLLTTQGTARVAEWMAAREEAPSEATPYTLVIGRYANHAEYVVLQNGSWHFGHHAVTRSPADCAYYGVALLERLDIPFDAVGRVRVYGEDVASADLAPLESVVGTEPAPLDPLPVVGLTPADLQNDIRPEMYVPCVGVTL